MLPKDGEGGATCLSIRPGEGGTGTLCGVTRGTGILLGDLDIGCGEISRRDALGVDRPSKRFMSDEGAS